MRSRLSTKGQLIIPKAMRDRHGWSAGSELVIEDSGDAILIRAARPGPETSLEELVGCTGYRGPARSLDDMHAAIARGIAEQRERSAASEHAEQQEQRHHRRSHE